MTRTTPELASPSPNFHATPTGGRLATAYDLACSKQAPYTVDLQWNRVSNLRPSCPEVETLPLGRAAFLEGFKCLHVIMPLIEGKNENKMSNLSEHKGVDLTAYSHAVFNTFKSKNLLRSRKFLIENYPNNECQRSIKYSGLMHFNFVDF
ncbi:hypothetical protein AVEN_252142-1 [Araneus ventricosus]|uniref:Uncharacterized protein n=1 Tax=Araneus ventricosus TaxID=182803 RepID=A0A4Y2HFH3_ARAVE|nr:hypothetical protein AVEN_252142-1 [Araneus ventricosus]